MGGSAISGDLLFKYLEDELDIPFIVQRNYELPKWVHGKGVLVVASSHSGNTEETLSVYEQAIERGCPIAAITTGGELSERAAENQIPLWKFEHKGQPRAAIGYSFAMLLNMFYRLGLIQDPMPIMRKAVDEMKLQEECIQASNPIRENAAKRLAGQW